LCQKLFIKNALLKVRNRDDAVKISEAVWIKTQKIRDNKLKRALMMELDEGEAETIVLALELSADLILLDDYDARKVARSFGLKVTGTIGILIKAKQEDKIRSLKKEINGLMKSGFWIDRELYKRILKESGEV